MIRPPRLDQNTSCSRWEENLRIAESDRRIILSIALNVATADKPGGGGGVLKPGGYSLSPKSGPSRPESYGTVDELTKTPCWSLREASVQNKEDWRPGRLEIQRKHLLSPPRLPPLPTIPPGAGTAAYHHKPKNLGHTN